MMLMAQIAIFISGYVIWNIDNFTCSWLTHAKRKIGMPLSFLLELHGWWHIFTGIGAYICMFLVPCHAPIYRLLEIQLTYPVIALVEYLTSEEAGEPLTGRFAWPIDMFLKKPRYTPSIARTGYGTLSKFQIEISKRQEAYMTTQAKPLRVRTNEAYEPGGGMLEYGLDGMEQKRKK